MVSNKNNLYKLNNFYFFMETNKHRKIWNILVHFPDDEDEE